MDENYHTVDKEATYVQIQEFTLAALLSNLTRGPGGGLPLGTARGSGPSGDKAVRQPQSQNKVIYSSSNFIALVMFFLMVDPLLHVLVS